MSIPYGRQTISDDDILEVSSSLKSDFLTTGPKVKEFENLFSKYVGSKYAVAVSSGTAALHISCLAAGLKKDDELITSPMTFAASANCALYCGAKPVFADINNSGLISPIEIIKKISKKTKIIIPVHYSGLPCNMEEIHKIAKDKKLLVIEDACHALGAKYKNSKIGDCKYSDMTVFSFHPVKHITTGEGGMITTNSKELYEKLIYLRTHGIKKCDDVKEPWKYEMVDLGFNYRITDFQCALGISQLKKINSFIERRISLAKRYNLFFKKYPVEIIAETKESLNPYHLYTIRLRDEKTRLNFFNFMKSKGINCQVHYIPVYFHPYYQKNGYKKGICPRAENFYNRVVSLPLFPSLNDKEFQFVTDSIKEFFEEMHKE